MTRLTIAGLPASLLVALILAAGAQGTASACFTDPVLDTYYAPVAPGSSAVDIVAACADDDGTSVTASIELMDLAVLEAMGQDPAYIAQYALTMHTTGNPSGFQIHASYGGVVYSGLDGPAWRFEVLDHGTGEWTPVNGQVAGNTVSVTVPHALLGNPVVGDEAFGLRAQAWAHAGLVDPQVGDHAAAPEGTVLAFS